MSLKPSRRELLLGGLSLAILGEPARAQTNALFEPGFSRDLSLLPPAESQVDFVIEPANLDSVPETFHKQLVNYPTPEFPGTVVVDPDNRHLYLIRENYQAVRYGVGVGREGFAWNGEAKVGLKRRWPRWVPPEEMVLRDEKAAKWGNGMPGGPDNPLGARALYLYANGEDTLYRIHGTNDPSSIGTAQSSGCVRMLNQDIADLYLRVPIGSKVVVLPSQGV